MALVGPPRRGAGLSRLDPARCVRAASDDRSESAGILLDQHICLMRGVLPPSAIEEGRRLAERRMLGTWGGNYFVLFGKPLGRAPTSRFEIDLSIILDVLRSPALDVARDYFRRRCGVADVVILPANVVARKFTPHDPAIDTIRLPFHQDASGFPEGFPVLNCWRLLSPDEAGRSSPGLEFVAARLSRLLSRERRPTSQNYHFIETSHVEVERLVAAHACWQPSVDLGDILMFDEFALHRTYLTSIQSQTRHSVEIRIIARTAEVLGHLAANPAPAYHLLGNALTGPAVMRQRGGKLREVRRGQWRLAPETETLGAAVLRRLKAPLTRFQ